MVGGEGIIKKGNYIMQDLLLDQMTMVYKLMASDDFSDAIATMLWKIYQKSREKGFSESDALAITLSFAKSHGGNNK